MTNNRPYAGFLDLAITIALIRVVCNHALNNYFILTTGSPVTFFEMPVWGRIVHLLVRFSVPLFVMIAGYKFELAFSWNPRQSYTGHLKKYLKRILRPYLIWTAVFYICIPFSFPIYIDNHPAFNNYPFPSLQTSWNILSGTNHPAYHLWFIPMFLTVVLLYPLIRRWVPTRISLPFLMILHLFIRSIDPGRPWVYASYLVFFDLGVFLSRVTDRYGKSPEFRVLTPTILTVTAGFFSLIVFISRSPIVSRLGDTGSEIFMPLAILYLCYTFLPQSAPENLKYLSRFVWPIFLIHEPFVLGQLAWFVYITLGASHPVAILFTVAGTLFFSGLIYTMLKKCHLASILF